MKEQEREEEFWGDGEGRGLNPGWPPSRWGGCGHYSEGIKYEKLTESGTLRHQVPLTFFCISDEIN